MQQHLESKTSFIVKDTESVSNINNIRSIYRKPSCVPNGFVAKLQREDTHMDFVTATVTSLTANDVMTKLMAFKAIVCKFVGNG